MRVRTVLDISCFAGSIPPPERRCRTATPLPQQGVAPGNATPAHCFNAGIEGRTQCKQRSEHHELMQANLQFWNACTAEKEKQLAHPAVT